MTPEYNNVYGEFNAPQGLEPALVAVKKLIGNGEACIYKSSFSGATSLRLWSDNVDLDSEHLYKSQHLFNGGVGGSLEEVIQWVTLLSSALTTAGIENQFEVYDENRNLQRRIPG